MLWQAVSFDNGIMGVKTSNMTCIRLAAVALTGPKCCRSSGVEHSLGKGEAESSILSGSTIFKIFCKRCRIALCAMVTEHAARPAVLSNMYCRTMVAITD